MKTEDERKEEHEEIKDSFEYTFDMGNLKPVPHIWVDRGLVMSCEGSTHANHRVFKRR